ncbi:MAG: hypothetical protein LBK27_04525 [Treponema sp.]|jgi:hypothetical protein|nr:hypothetical protein [Treponema sp.]
MKKIIGLLVMVCVLSAAIFAQEDVRKHQHEPLDMLLGINLGTSLFLEFKDMATDKPKASFFRSADFGLTYDFYVFSWLSATTGLFLHPQFSIIWKEEYANRPDIEAKDIIQFPLCLTIPLQAHVNVPRAEWLYLGAGVNLNIPITSLMGEAAKVTGLIGLETFDSKGKFFVSVPLDFGFDLIQSRDGGARFFFRFTPAFLEQKTLVPFGIVCQIYNFRIGD